MKINIKRVYCDSCKKLIRGIEKTVNGHMQISCSKCGKTLRVLEGAVWRPGI